MNLEGEDLDKEILTNPKNYPILTYGAPIMRLHEIIKNWKKRKNSGRL